MPALRRSGRCFTRYRNGLHNLVHDFRGSDAVYFGLRRDNEPVRNDERRDVLHIVGSCIVAAVYRGQEAA